MKIKPNSRNMSTVVEVPESVLSNQKNKKIEGFLSSIPFIGKSKPTIAILRLEGVIGKVGSMKSGLTLNSLNKLIEKAFNVDRLAAVCLSINSPGGAPVQAELITNRIISLAKEKNVPVYSFVEDVAASGGYWLACAGERIFVNSSSVIGSIGVISSGFGFTEALGKLGIERRVYTQGKSKSVLDPFQPAKESDIKIVKKIQADIHEHFISSVKMLRAGRLTQNDDILFNGEFWAGQTAIDYGLVDEIGDLYSFIKQEFGKKVKIEYIERKQSWFQRRLGMINKAEKGNISSESLVHDLTEAFIDSMETRLDKDRFKFK